MKKWMETCEVLTRLHQVLGAGGAAALATVVRVVGSAYRREGAKLLVASDGSTFGNVSGGCLEQDVIQVAQRVLRTDSPELRTYCSSEDRIEAWNLGLGCDGRVDVHVAPMRGSLPLARVALSSLAPVPFVLCTDLEGQALTVTTEACEGHLGSPDLTRAVRERAHDLLTHDRGTLEMLHGRSIFFDAFDPPPALVICGAGEDAPALVRLAASVGFRVAVVDRRPGRLDAARFGGAARLIESDGESLPRLIDPTRSYAVLMTHNFADDVAYLGALVATSIPYIGILGPRERTNRMLEATASRAAAALQQQRLYAPVGLDIGADGAEQVALAIVAEVLAFRSGRQVQSLRERALSIHA
ncbi:MAG TPA: XdhC family protein [Gemmatimonadales bacterium]|nr:XdhC family protein [Gemmatimonadales bacterium]